MLVRSLIFVFCVVLVAAMDCDECRDALRSKLCTVTGTKNSFPMISQRLGNPSFCDQSASDVANCGAVGHDCRAMPGVVAETASCVDNKCVVECAPLRHTCGDEALFGYLRGEAENGLLM